MGLIPKPGCVAGVSTVVSCISTDAQTDQFYLCFACEECFPESGLERHFASKQHLIHTLVSSLPLFPTCRQTFKKKKKNSRKLGVISLSILFLSNQTLLFPSSALPESLASAFCLGEYAECDSHAVHGAGGGEGTRSGSDTEGELKKIQKENNNPLCC